MITAAYTVYVTLLAQHTGDPELSQTSAASAQFRRH